jgi:predicted nucleic acid-binding protein
MNMPKKSPEPLVLDAWALVALLFGQEPAAAVVRELFATAGTVGPPLHASWINLGEVYYTVAKRQSMDTAEDVLSDILRLALRVHEPSRKDILAAARLKAVHRLSYADAFAVGLAEKLGAVICTGDSEIVGLSTTIQVMALSRA